MISVRGGAGLGDAIYVQSVARYWVGQGRKVEVCTHWSEVFSPIKDYCRFSPFRRDNISSFAHYYSRRGVRGTTQWEDVCVTAGIPKTTELLLDWVPACHASLEVIKRAGCRKIALVGMPRAPFDRKDRFGNELLPKPDGFRRVVDRVRQDMFTVMVGRGTSEYDVDVDLNMVNLTSVTDLIDFASVADLLVGQPSYMIPLAESLDKKSLIVWSRRAHRSKHEVVRQITPEKIIHRKDLVTSVYDDASEGLVGNVYQSVGTSELLHREVGRDSRVGSVSADKQSGVR